MDDVKARRELKKRGIKPIWTLGVLDEAAERGLIDDLSERLDRLERQTSFYVGEKARAVIEDMKQRDVGRVRYGFDGFRRVVTLCFPRPISSVFVCSSRRRGRFAFLDLRRMTPREPRMTQAARQQPAILAFLARSPLALSAWAVVAAFGAYFCTYAFRKPWTAATFADATVWGVAEKSVLVVAQVLGYMLAKVIGIRVIAEMPPHRRTFGIVALIAGAEVSLVLFGAAPSPMHVLGLFLNGLALGMVFGLVLGFLEGRRHTEALTAGLCASFILADGMCKSVGAWLLSCGVSERWMPAAAGLAFLPPTLLFAWMLTQVPPPSSDDVALRSERSSMDRTDRAGMLGRHGFGIMAIVAAYLFVSIARGVRADFAPEIWKALGMIAVPATFSNSEVLVALGVLVANGLSVLILDNRKAFFASIGVGLGGCVLMIAALVGQQRGLIGPFPFMVMLGLGLYLPYVAVHTTIFERMIAMTRDRGNLGFLLYVADAAGYMAYAGLVLFKGWLPVQTDPLQFFMNTWWAIGFLTILSLGAGWLYFAARSARPLRAEVVT
jgi:hypothetical protein